MGNKPQPQGQQQQQQQLSIITNSNKTTIVLPMRTQQIILHNAFKMKLRLTDVETFPHGLDGLKIWQAGIVLARYAILNCSMFRNKNVLELGSGVGIAGIAIKKWTQCRSIQLSDYHPQVVDLIKSNSLKNNQKIEANIFDWREREKLAKTYDIIVGSDIVYFGCPVRDLYMVFEEKLKVGGKGVIVIPERKNYAELFIKEINKDVFDVQFQQLTDELYKQSPLEDLQKAKYEFSLLWEIGFKALIITKKDHKQHTV